jgi:uroporphyrinogen-III synthase
LIAFKLSAGTGKELKDADPRLHIAFCPSIANAATLASELPLEPHQIVGVTPELAEAFQELGSGDGARRVLYPASARAKLTLQEGLKDRGFDVMRLDTYDTKPVTECSETELREALQCDVVCIASPSALKAWVNMVGMERARQLVLACIGSTSGKAALEMGFERDRVFWDDSPGMDGFVRSIEAALDAVHLIAAHT